MYRDLSIPCIYDGRKYNISVRQEIDNMEDNTYYTFNHRMSKFEFMVGSPYTLDYKLVIVGDTGRRARVFFTLKLHLIELLYGTLLLKGFVHKLMPTNWGS